MSKLVYSSSIQRPYSAGAGLQAATVETLGIVKQNTTWLNSGTGTDDRTCPKQAIKLYDATTTGDNTLDLSAVADGYGATIDFDNLRYLAITNHATASTHTLSVGAHGTTPFFSSTGSILIANTTVIVVQPQTTVIFVYKPLGAGIAVGTAINLKLAFGSNQFAVSVDIKGY